MRTRPATLACVDGRGILVELSPHGAYTLLGVPLWEVTNTVIDVADVLGPTADQIMARLAETSTWQSRLALLDDALAARSEIGPRAAPQVVWAWRQLCRSHGRVPVDRLAAEVGWTRRHLLTRFREQIGVPPKTAARMIRFQSALHLLLRSEPPPSFARLAQATGYSDQAHLTREFRTLTGTTPVELTAAWPYHD
nr:helix-turn-helix domain-containing protein [Kibdelosporangium sp. MJ126-NF4]